MLSLGKNAVDGLYLGVLLIDGIFVSGSRCAPYHNKERRRNSDRIIPVAIATFSDSDVGASAGYGGIKS